MRLTKTLLVLGISVFLDRSFLYAQQPGNSPHYSNKSFIDPSDTRYIDSLYRVNELNIGTNRLALSSHQFGNAGSNRITLPRQLFFKMAETKQAVTTGKVNLSESPNSVCYTYSGRDFLKQDSLIIWTGNSKQSSDGNIIVPGEFADYAYTPLHEGAFCMKTTINGDMIWAKLYDSTGNTTQDFLNLFQSLELQDGSILLAGRTTNKISGNNDFVLTKLDNNGNLIWFKTYASRYWQGFTGSGDFFALRGLQQDPATGEIYFAGHHWGGMSTITKVDPSDGHIIWSNGYNCFSTDHVFDMIINSNNLFLFQLENGSGNESIVDATAISKTTGDTLFSKHYRQTGDLSAARLYSTFGAVKLNNGHFLLSGPTTRFWEYPIFTGTIDLFHAGIIELDQNFNYVTAYGFSNRIESNGYNTKVSLYPDGNGLFTMFNYISGYTGKSEVCLFNDTLIYHQRKRIHINEGLPYEPPSLQLPDGGFLNIKLMGDSTATAPYGSRVDYYRVHTSDTASMCLGIRDTANKMYYFNFEPIYGRRIDTVRTNIFSVSRVKTYNTWNFETTREPTCSIISDCDTLDISSNPAIVCPGTSATITIHKNPGCGSLVPLVYDTNFVSQVTKINDTLFLFRFDQPGSSYIKGSLMGCTLMKDSVLVQVIPAINSLNIGPDTVICPGNHIILNAGSGFASYLWSDGSSDSILTVTAPGTYYVTTVNSCGGVYSDTVVVAGHAPIPFSAGPDRTKCNNDTLRLTATAGFMNYQWSPIYNINSPTSQQVIVNPLVDTTYTVAAEKTTGCFAYDTVHITVKTSPVIHLGSDTSICRNDSLVLNAGSGFVSYQWSTGSTQQQLLINQPGTYSIKAAWANGCSSADTLRLISLYNLPQPQLGSDPALCMGQPRVLGSPGNFAVYLWSTGATSNTISVNSLGSYWLSVTDNNGCHGADTISITTVAFPPTGFLGTDTAICSYGNLVLKPVGNFQRYLWSSGSAGSFITIVQPGNYWLDVIDQNDCQGRDTILVSLKDCVEGLFVPSAFTPDNDGLNDVLMPVIFGHIRSLKFQVFNRWGEIVFQTTTPGKGWDGKYKGEVQDGNIFVWTCSYQLDGKNLQQKSGTVVIIR